MNPRPRNLATNALLDFFGQVTASATHEIKNGLAVINEQSRLAGELIELSRQGRELDPERLAGLIDRVVHRIAQTDLVVRRLNKFAHSAGLDRESVDAAELLPLMAQMYGRLASMKKVTLVVADDLPRPVLVKNGFLVQLAIWTCLEETVAVLPKGGQADLHLRLDRKRAVFLFRGQLTEPPGSPPAWLLEALDGQAQAIGREGLQLSVPTPGGD